MLRHFCLTDRMESLASILLSNMCQLLQSLTWVWSTKFFDRKYAIAVQGPILLFHHFVKWRDQDESKKTIWCLNHHKYWNFENRKNCSNLIKLAVMEFLKYCVHRKNCNVWYLVTIFGNVDFFVWFHISLLRNFVLAENIS